MAGRHTGQGRTATAAAGGSRTGAPGAGASEIGFAELPAAVSAPFATLPPEVIYRREKERRAMTGADAISSAMEEARREFAAMLAADRPKGTGGRPAKNGRGRPAAATQPVVADELDHEGHDVEEITLGAAGDLDEGDAVIDPAVEEPELEVEAPEEVEVVTRRPAAAAPAATRRAGNGTKRAAKTPSAPVRGKATTSSSSNSRSTAQTRRRQSARPAAAPARSRRGTKATASSSSGGSRRGGSATRAGARGSKR